MELKIKALSPKIGTEIPLPRFATAGAACMDLCACIDEGLVNLGSEPYTVQPGDRIAQLMVVPVVQPTVTVAEDLDETDRGAGGFGSTGR